MTVPRNNSVMTLYAPREGITFEYLLRPLRLSLQPSLTGPLLYALSKYPEKFSQYLSRAAIEKTSKYVKILLVLGLIRKVNAWLSKKAVNNWVTDTYRWDKEVVLITGGSSGIGELVVRRLAQDAITVVVLDIIEPKTPFSSTVHFYKANVTSVQDIKEVAARIRVEVGDPTILVNNAGIALGRSILDETPEQVQKLIDINLTSHFTLIREFLPSMVQHNHGHVLTMASLASYYTHSHNVSYAASKNAVLAVHEGLTQELRFHYHAPKVRTSIVHPWWVRTQLLADLTKPKFKSFELNPNTVADAIVEILLSGESKQIILPHRYSPVVGLLRAMPNWLQDYARNTQGTMLHH